MGTVFFFLFFLFSFFVLFLLAVISNFSSLARPPRRRRPEAHAHWHSRPSLRRENTSGRTHRRDDDAPRRYEPLHARLPRASVLFQGLQVGALVLLPSLVAGDAVALSSTSLSAAVSSASLLAALPPPAAPASALSRGDPGGGLRRRRQDTQHDAEASPRAARQQGVPSRRVALLLLPLVVPLPPQAFVAP